MAKRKKKSVKLLGQKLGPIKRIIYLILGLAGLVTLLMYSFNFEKLPFQITIFSQDITTIILAVAMVILGIIFSTLLKSGAKGKFELDS